MNFEQICVHRQMIGIRAGLPLPSGWEMFAQLLVYFLIEDYTNYWIHRFLHNKWGYEKIHRVHHEYTAPIGYAAPYAHWAEVLILGIPSFLGPAMVPGHMITFWLWISLRNIEAIDTHSGYAWYTWLFYLLTILYYFSWVWWNDANFRIFFHSLFLFSSNRILFKVHWISWIFNSALPFCWGVLGSVWCLFAFLLLFFFFDGGGWLGAEKGVLCFVVSLFLSSELLLIFTQTN